MFPVVKYRVYKERGSVRYDHLLEEAPQHSHKSGLKPGIVKLAGLKKLRRKVVVSADGPLHDLGKE